MIYKICKDRWNVFQNMWNNCRFLIFLVFMFIHTIGAEQPMVTARLWGRLGNHLFIIAATTSLALDNDAIPLFPDFITAFDPDCDLKGNYVISNLRTNYTHMFSHLNTSKPSEEIAFVYREPHFNYSPIPYHPNMLLEGWFQSEKYFINHKDEIVSLFAPSAEITDYLSNKYKEIIESPNTVAVHLRCYTKEDPKYDNIYPTHGREYFKKAMEYFDADAQFIVFSDQIEWAKRQLRGIPRNIRYIEGEKYYHDFYLMSMCKHNIISNSTFSWWAAYLNSNPSKVVTVPCEWFTPEYNHNTSDLIPDEWIKI